MPIEIAVALGSCLLLVLISAVYFHLGKTVTLRKRIAASAHALLVAGVLPYGLFVDAVTRGKPDEMAQLPILLLLVLAAASIVYSVWALRDRPLLHLAHLITVALAIPLTFFGAVAIVGWT
jgi:cytochrome bd-type quinol oxidase subunit 2